MSRPKRKPPTKRSKPLKLTAHGKVNLTLEVVALLPDGYHALDTVFCSTELGDEVELHRADHYGLEVTWEGLRPAALPVADNLVTRAVGLLERHTQTELPVAIRLVKHLPAGGGMGGGSSDAAAVMVGLNRMFSLELSESRLVELAAELGADVAFCLRGGTARGRARGHRLELLPAAPALDVVLVFPPFGCSTPAVYASWDRLRCRPAKGASDGLVEALESGDEGRLPSCLANDLQPAAEILHPQLRDVCAEMYDCGCQAVLLSGSGSTCFGLTGSIEPERIAGRLERRKVGGVRLTRLRGTARAL